MFRLIPIVLFVFAGQLTTLAQPAGPRFAILAGDLIAPATLHVSAADMPVTVGTALTTGYEWDFGDPGTKFNTLRGFNAAHTYDRPGIYNIRLTLRDERGRVQQFEQRVMIKPPVTRTIYVAQSGSDRNDGSSPATALRSVARAVTLSGNNARILLRRGDVFAITETLRLGQRNLTLGAYGTAAEDVIALPHMRVGSNNPRLLWSGPRNGAPMIETTAQARDITIQDITFNTTFNSDTEKRNVPAVVRPMGVNLTMRRCVLLNVSDGINAHAAPRGVLMQECIAPSETGLRSYLAWIEGADQVYLGNIAVNSTREAVMRISNGGASRVLIAHNQLTNLDRTQVDRIDTAKNALTVHFGSHVYITGNTLRVGPTMIGPLGERDGFRQKASTLNTVVFEGNLVEGAGLRVNHGMKGLVVRQNRFRSDNATAINIEGFNREYNRGSSDLTIVNNTAVNRGRRGNFLRVGGGVRNLQVMRNLFVAPELMPGRDHTATVYVGQKDLSGITRMTENIWPITQPTPFAAGGAFYIWPSWSDTRGYVTLSTWNALTKGSDRERAVRVNDQLWIEPDSKDVGQAGARNVSK